MGQVNVQGRITDKITGESIPGVTIYIPDYLQGTVSDLKGEYAISGIRKGEVLIQFLYMGYKTVIKKIELTDHDLILNIEMETTVIQSDEIVVTGSFTGSQHENVVRINAISPKEFKESGTPSFIETMSNVPGVNVISKGPGIGTPVIRGLSLSNIVVLNNGIPMQNFQFSENHPFMVDEYGVDKVEIIKGPASLLYGSGAVGGVLNIIKSPPVPLGKIEGDFNVKYFSNTEGISSNLGVNGNNKNFIWGVRGGLNSNKDYFDGEYNRIPNSRFNRKSLKLHAGLIRPFGSFRFFYDYNKDELGLTVPPSVILVPDNGRNNDVWYQDLTNHVFAANNKLFLGKVKIDLNLAYQLNNRKLHESDFSEERTSVNMDLSTFSYTLKSRIPASDKTCFIFGLQGMHQANKNNEAPEHVIPDGNINDFSVFAVGQHFHWNLLKIEAGIRYDYRSIHVPKQEAGGEHSHDEKACLEDAEFIQLDKTYHNLNGSLGSVLNLSEQFLIRLNIASAFRSPNLAELTQQGMHGPRYEEGNPELSSQRSLEADLDFHYHTKHTTINISGFYNNINDYVYLSPTTDTLEDGDAIYRYLQTNATIYGGEIALHVHPHPYDWLHIKSSYAYILGKQNNGEYLPFIPANKFHLELKVNLNSYKKLNGLFIKAGTDLVFNQNHPGQFETPTDSYTLVNAGFGGNVKIMKQNITFGIFANNILNEVYIDHLSTLKGMELNNIGRNITFSLSIPFSIKN